MDSHVQNLSNFIQIDCFSALNSYLAQNNFEQAISLLEEELKKTAYRDNVKSAIIELCIQGFQFCSNQNDVHRGSLLLLKALKVNPKLVDITSYKEIYQILLNSGDFNSIEELLNCGLSLEDSKEEMLLLQSEVRFHLGKIDLAIVSLKEVIACDPEKYKPDNKTHVNLSLPAKVWRVRDALDDLNIRLDKLSVSDERLNMAIGFARVGQISNACKSLEAIEDRNINMEFALGMLYLSWAEIANRGELYEVSKKYFLNTQSQNEDRDETYYFLAYIERSSMNFKNALELFKKVLEVNPNHELALKGAGEATARLYGQTTSALAYLGRYLEVQKERQENHPLGKTGLRFLLPYNVWAMGHLGELPEAFLKLKKLGKIPNYNALIVAPEPLVANTTLLDCWKEHFEVISDEQDVIDIMRVSKELEFDTSFYLNEDRTASHMIVTKSRIEKEWTAKGRAPLLTLPKEINDEGWKIMESLGMKKGQWFVTAHAREGGFKKEQAGGFNSHRNTNIDSYGMAFDSIREKGGWVVRMGEPSMKKLGEQDATYDYAHSEHKSSWMDIFLLANSKFFLSGTAGVYSTPLAFGVPIAFANWTPSVPLLYGPKEMYIFKLLWSEPLNRYLTLKEAMSAPFLYCEENSEFKERGISFVDNTKEEINDFVVEMFDRIEGKVEYSKEDEELQARFGNILPDKYGTCTMRVGREYAKKYSDLF